MFLHMLLWLKSQFGLELATIACGRAFGIGVIDQEDFEIIPRSSGEPRIAHRRYAERYYSRFIATGSTRVSDYKDIGVNASYFLSLFREFARHFATCTCAQKAH